MQNINISNLEAKLRVQTEEQKKSNNRYESALAESRTQHMKSLADHQAAVKAHNNLVKESKAHCTKFLASPHKSNEETHQLIVELDAIKVQLAAADDKNKERHATQKKKRLIIDVETTKAKLTAANDTDEEHPATRKRRVITSKPSEYRS